MSKADTLLKKATFFERMALYSDRKAFLQAVAQESQAQQPDPNRQLIQQALTIMQNAGVDEATTAPLGNAVLFNKVDLPAIQRAIQTATLTKMSPLTQQAQIDQLRQLARQMKAAPTEAESAMAGPADMTFSPDPSKDRITALPPINPADQQAVFRFVTINGLGLPGKADGKLGKETRTALEAIKDYFAKANPQNPRMSDAEAIRAAKFQGR